MPNSTRFILPARPGHELLTAYQQHGENCIFHVDTEFAFVVHNKTSNTYFAARDPLGLSPLYYCYHEGKFCFSSAIEDILQLAGFKKQVNTQVMGQIINCATIPYTETMFSGIKRLPPGHCMRTSPGGECLISRYWKPETIKVDYRIRKKQAIETFTALFDQAIRNRMDSAATTACELSGGLDSSSIVSWIKHNNPDYKLNCLSMTFDSFESCNENEYIEQISKAYDVNLVKLKTDTMDYENKYSLDYNYKLNPHWPIFITYTMGFPLVEKAKQLGITTVLTGQGGDHVMTGNLYCLNDYLREFRWKRLIVELGAFGFPFWMIKRFVLLPLLGLNTRKIIRKLLHPLRKTEAEPTWKPKTEFEEYSELYTGKSRAFKFELGQLVDSYNSALYENSYYQVAENKYGIKFRHPFFDRKLVEFMLSLPPWYKVHKGSGKYLLREAMKGILPEKIRTRESKAQFTEVLQQQINAVDLEALFKHAHIVRLGLIEESKLTKMVGEYQSGKTKNIIQFWQILNVEYWYRYNFTSTPE